MVVPVGGQDQPIGIVTALMAAAVVAIWMPNTRMREMAENRPEAGATRMEPATD